MNQGAPGVDGQEFADVEAYRAIDAYATMRLRRWLRKQHTVRRNGWLAYPPEYLYQTLGLVCLPTRQRNVPWAKA